MGTACAKVMNSIKSNYTGIDTDFICIGKGSTRITTHFIGNGENCSRRRIATEETAS